MSGNFPILLLSACLFTQNGQLGRAVASNSKSEGVYIKKANCKKKKKKKKNKRNKKKNKIES